MNSARDSQVSQERPLLLLTNDDGFGVEGITASVNAAAELGDIMVILPKDNHSGLSHRITMRECIAVQQLQSPWPQVNTVYVVDGTPADCVRLGIFSLSKKPFRLVIAGTNHGANMGEDVVYSGTVAAARESALLGIPSMAVSVASRKIFPTKTVSHIIKHCTEWMLSNNFPKGTHFNINIPPMINKKKIKYLFTSLGKRKYGTKYVKTRINKNTSFYMLKEHISGFKINGTDIQTIAQKNISITPLTLSFTDLKQLKQLKRLKVRI